jgi:hygromycin-B 7''-O-kinase
VTAREPGYSLAQVRARAALQDAGLPPSVELAPASSVTNEVWLTPDHVVRVAARLGSRLHREALLAKHLPPEVRCPPVVAAGSGGGGDWLVLRRMPGTPLAHRWPELSRGERRRAITELANVLRALHRTAAPANLPELEPGPQLVDLTSIEPLDPLRTALGQASTLPGVPLSVLRDAAKLVEKAARGAVGPELPTTLVHGDLTFENVLWHDRVSALLDFEWSRPGPPELDLDVLLRTCAHPELHVASEHESRTRAADYREVPGWLAEDYPELFDVPQLLDRLRIFAISFEVGQLLDDRLSGANEPVPERHPLHRLRRLVVGRSHLDDLAADGLLT